MAGEHDKKKWPWWVKLLLGVSPLLILLAAGLIWDGIAFGRLNAVMEEVEAAGFKTSLADLEAERKVWAEEENGALVIVPIMDELDALGKANGSLLDLVSPGVDRQNKRLGCRWDEETMREVDAFLSDQQSLLEQIDRLADFEGGRFPLDVSGPAIEILLPHLSPVRSSIKLKALQVEEALCRGETESFVDGVEIMRRHSILLADEPILISHLVAQACEMLMLATIERGLGLVTLSAEQLEALNRTLTGMSPRTRLESALQGELSLFVDCSERFRDGEFSEVLKDLGMPSLMRAVPGIRGALVADQAFGVEHYQQLIAAAMDPVTAPEVTRALDKRTASAPRYFFVSRTMLPSIGRVFEMQLWAEGKVACTRIALAAERYRLDHGRFPAQLDELVPDYLDALPVDPVDEKPMRYLTDEDGAVVYSVGQDGVDDGGMVEHRVEEGESPDVGFVLLKPELRGRPAPETQPGE